MGPNFPPLLDAATPLGAGGLPGISLALPPALRSAAKRPGAASVDKNHPIYKCPGRPGLPRAVSEKPAENRRTRTLPVCRGSGSASSPMGLYRRRGPRFPGQFHRNHGSHHGQPGLRVGGGPRGTAGIIRGYVPGQCVQQPGPQRPFRGSCLLHSAQYQHRLRQLRHGTSRRHGKSVLPAVQRPVSGRGGGICG
jgi:hypothetical protein